MNKLFWTSALAVVLLISAFAPSACYYDNEEELYGSSACDTSTVRYSVEIQKIMQDNCYACHTTTNNSSGFPFEDYAGLKSYVDNQKLIDRITDATNPMPPAGLMTNCEISKVKAWVNAGAPNN